VPHEIIFIQASIQPVRLHERPEDATIWDDTNNTKLDTKIGRIHKSLSPTVKKTSALRFPFWALLLMILIFSPLQWPIIKEKVPSRKEPLVERIIFAISGIRCNVKASNQNGEIEVTPQRKQDLLLVRFVFMTAQSLNTIAKEERGLMDTSIPKLANLCVISGHDAEGFPYLQQLAKKFSVVSSNSSLGPT